MKKPRFTVMLWVGEHANFYHVVDWEAPEDAQPQILYTRLSRPAAQGIADWLNETSSHIPDIEHVTLPANIRLLYGDEVEVCQDCGAEFSDPEYLDAHRQHGEGCPEAGGLADAIADALVNIGKGRAGGP